MCCVKHLHKSKEVRTSRYLSLVAPLRKVNDEAVHKELGDIIERAITTASSFEAEQDIDAQTRFETTSKQSNDPPLSKVNTFGSGEDKSVRFAEIIDFLKASFVNYALIVNPIIYTSCMQQFWAAQVKTVNGVRQLRTLIDKKKIIITESSIRSDLHLDDAEASKEVGKDSDHQTDSTQIPIIDQPSTSSQPKKKQKSRRKQRKEAEVANDETEQEDSVPTPSNDPLPSPEDCMQLNGLMVLDLEKAKSDQAVEIASLKKRVNKLEKRIMFRTTGLQRLKQLGTARRVKSSNASLGAQKDASKQGRSIKDIDIDAKVTLVNETQEWQNEDMMFYTGVLDDDEVFVDVTTGEKDEQSTKLDNSITGEEVTTASIEDSAAPTIQVSTGDIGGVTAAKIEELTLAQALLEIKSAKPKVVITTATTTTTTRPKARGVVVQEPSEFRTSSEAQPSMSKDKGKAIMIEPEVPLKRKDQVAIDEDLAREIQAMLDAEIIEEEKLARQKKEEANIALIESWDNIQAMMEADFELAQKLQTKEQGEITIEERSKLFVELMNKRKKHFAMLIA
ncbi:hypothetical protein Tco_0804437 [Tanacetum coccineum]|uniref:Xylulose kinase-1 n=1 Tax=Tanacetum coccineum TaxID=301880 RepID=A0ABQ5A4A5_9ASTR